MRRFFSVLVSFILFIVLLFLVINFSIESIVVDTLSDSLVKREVSDVVTDVIYKMYPDISVDNLGKINDMVENSEEVKEITEKYFSNIMDSINEGNYEYPDITDELDSLILNNRSNLIEYGVDSDDIDRIVSELDNNDSINQVYQAVNDNLVGNLTEEQKLVVDIYNMLSSDDLRYGLIIGIVVMIGVLCLINWNLYSWLIYAGISSLVAGLVTKVVIIEGINMVAWDVTNKILGRTSDINVEVLNNLSMIYMLVGAILIGVYIIIRKLLIKR